MFSPTFPELQGLVGLPDKTGIEIRPTLLRVLTDLYVQKPVHSDDEEHHYVELATRQLIDRGRRSDACSNRRATLWPIQRGARGGCSNGLQRPSPPARCRLPGE